MNTAPHAMDSASGVRARTSAAWSAFWADSAQSRCAAGAPGIWAALNGHWTSLGKSLEGRTRVLDLGCGAGVVGQLLLGARSDLRVTGIDSAKVPASSHPRLELLSRTDMESMPFVGRQFGAVVSQYGFEYSQMGAAAREVARVAAPGARLSFIVHHSGSAIVDSTRVRLAVIDEFLGPVLGAAFCSGDAAAFDSELTALMRKHEDDALALHLARALPPRLGSPPAHRLAIWTALEVALEPERRVSESLLACCVSPARLDEWLEPLRHVCALETVSELRETNGDPVAWKIQGEIAPATHAVAPAS